MVVVALTGYLLVTNLRANRTAVVNSDTAQLVEQRVKEVDGLSADVKKLSSDVSTLTELTAKNSDIPATSEDSGTGTTLPKVEGPGIAVTLDDSPMWEQAVDSSGSSDDIDKYVIHQQDLEAVINALWAGGADSMQFMDQRMLFNSAVICSGNVVSLHGKKYSPPFTISAIGDPDQLVKALDDSPAIEIYKQYVSAFGLGWKVERKKSLTFDETPSLLQPLKYATVVKGKNDETSTDTTDAQSGDTASGRSATEGK
ncbi:membrane protein [Bifidobacterium stellenboschense]|uniref:Membrane protein n=2 Tax=Bifidobacterium stellenboschense TaxID=762211 RepID=A0A087DJG2_9BIFI|nr:membrane protein [Bifidobacterium stellenboschense]